MYRDGGVKSTSGFLDSMTETVQIILVFFTPTSGVTSVMTVSADFSGYSSTQIEVNLDHFEILEGHQLYAYLVVQSIVLLSIGVMVCDIMINIRHILQGLYRREKPSASSVIKQLVDIGTACMVTVFIALRIPSKVNSA